MVVCACNLKEQGGDRKIPRAFWLVSSKSQVSESWPLFQTTVEKVIKEECQVSWHAYIHSFDMHHMCHPYHTNTHSLMHTHMSMHTHKHPYTHMVKHKHTLMHTYINTQENTLKVRHRDKDWDRVRNRERETQRETEQTTMEPPWGHNSSVLEIKESKKNDMSYSVA